MALAAQVKIIDFTRRRKRVTLAITFSGNYVAGGDTLDLTAVTNPKFLGAPNLGVVPDEATVNNDAGGYGFEFIAGSALNNGKVKIFSVAGTELAAGAYPAALTGDTLYLTLTAKAFRS